MLTILCTLILMSPAIMIAAHQTRGTRQNQAKACVLCKEKETTQSICQPCWEMVERK